MPGSCLRLGVRVADSESPRWRHWHSLTGSLAAPAIIMPVGGPEGSGGEGGGGGGGGCRGAPPPPGPPRCEYTQKKPQEATRRHSTKTTAGGKCVPAGSLDNRLGSGQAVCDDGGHEPIASVRTICPTFVGRYLGLRRRCARHTLGKWVHERARARGACSSSYALTSHDCRAAAKRSS